MGLFDGIINQFKEVFAAPEEESVPSVTLEDLSQFNLKFTLSEPRYIERFKNSIMLMSPDDYVIIAKDFKKINILVEEVRKELYEPYSFIIDPKQFYYDTDFSKRKRNYYTYFICQPYTPTGRLAKYPLQLRYAYSNHYALEKSLDYFGNIFYSQDGEIGKAELVFWHERELRVFHLSRVDGELVVSKVEGNLHLADGRMTILYKHEA